MVNKKYCVRGSKKLSEYISQSGFRNPQCFAGVHSTLFYYITDDDEWSSSSIQPKDKIETYLSVFINALSGEITPETGTVHETKLTKLETGMIYETLSGSRRTIIKLDLTIGTSIDETGHKRIFDIQNVLDLLDNHSYKLIHNNQNDKTNETSTDNNGERTATAIISNPTRQIASGCRLTGNAKTTIVKTTRIGRFKISSNIISI